MKEIAKHLLMAGKPLSLRKMAEAASVDQATLRYYFGDRRGMMQAVYASLLPFGEIRHRMAMELLSLPAQDAFITLLTQVAEGWPIMLGGLHAIGFAEGFADTALGEQYVTTILEPTLATFEQMLQHYHEVGQLHVPDARVAALALAGPPILALFHQHQLSGERCRPLDMSAYVHAHVAAFIRGYRRES